VFVCAHKDEGSRLFIPPSIMVALRGSAGGGMALKYCFVDASNLNTVKEQAQLEVSTPFSDSAAAPNVMFTVASSLAPGPHSP